MDAPHTVNITGLTYGPHALARLDGKVLFVRGAVPGDVVTVAVREARPRFAYADVTSVITPSPDRRPPPCPYLPACGGCPWQQMAYAAQLRAKEANVRDHLNRTVALADADWRPIIPSAHEFAYRHRLSLRVADKRVGFFAGGSHDLVRVDRCLLGETTLDDAIPVAERWVAQLSSAVQRLEIFTASDGVRWVFLGEAEGALAKGDGSLCEAFRLGDTRVAGMVLRGKRTRQVWGDDRCGLELEPGLPWVVRAGTFTQVNRAGNRVLIDAVLDAAALHSEHCVLDLFAGAGNLSLPMARRVARVTAVERGAQAVDDGVANARRLAVSNCEFRCGAARDALRAARRRGEHFDLVVLDPPRSGAADVMPDLLALAPPRIVYVACDPATLARDLGVLAARYRIARVQPIDLFPHTYHVETVVTAILT